MAQWVRAPDCSSKGLEFKSQQPRGGSQPSITRSGREVELSKTEFQLLELLLRNQGIVLDHSTIYDRIWGYDFGPDSKNLAVYMSYLRRKLELDGEPKFLHTVRGVGYTARLE